MSIQEYQCPYCPDDDPFRARRERKVRKHITTTDDHAHGERDGFSPSQHVIKVHEDPMRNFEHGIQRDTVAWEICSLRIKHPHLTPTQVADYVGTSTSSYFNSILKYPAIERERERRLMVVIDDDHERASRTIAPYGTQERDILEYVDENPDARAEEVRDALDITVSDADVRQVVSTHTLPPNVPDDPEIRDRILLVAEAPEDESTADTARKNGYKPRVLQGTGSYWDIEMYDTEVLRGLQYPEDLGWTEDDSAAQTDQSEPEPERAAELGVDVPGTATTVADGAGGVATTPQTREAIEGIQDDLDALSARLAPLEEQVNAIAEGVTMLQQQADSDEGTDSARLTDEQFGKLMRHLSANDPDLAEEVLPRLR